MKYLDKEKVTCEVIYGGEPIQKHVDLLKKKPPTILIGTPGRMYSLVKQKKIDFTNMKHFILDECDQMLEALDMR
jgi:ATP-dependent RNA helicase UAP56/SUB2